MEAHEGPLEVPEAPVGHHMLRGVQVRVVRVSERVAANKQMYVDGR